MTGDRGKDLPALEVRFVRRTVQRREEVVPRPQAVDAQLVDALPARPQGGHGRVLRMDLNADLHDRSLSGRRCERLPVLVGERVLELQRRVVDVDLS